MKPPTIKTTIVTSILCAAMILSIGITQVSRKQRSVALRYQLTEITDTLRELQEQNHRLRLEKSRLTDPTRIESLVRSMGMHRPMPEQVRTIAATRSQQSHWENHNLQGTR